MLDFNMTGQGQHFGLGSPKNKLKSVDWEISRSSLKQIKGGNPSYKECRDFACNDITAKLTQIPDNALFITEIPPGTNFSFLVRVGTDIRNNPNNPNTYYRQFKEREYVSYSIISNKNISHYGIGGNILFAYNVPPESIAHIFPMDSDTDPIAKSEDELTEYPSLWYTLDDLNATTLKFKTYNQITCATKHNGEIIKPFAVIAINKLDDYTKSVAEAFNIKCIIVHPNKSAICETFDPFFVLKKEDAKNAREVFETLKKLYSISQRL